MLSPFLLPIPSPPTLRPNIPRVHFPWSRPLGGGFPSSIMGARRRYLRLARDSADSVCLRAHHSLVHALPSPHTRPRTLTTPVHATTLHSHLLPANTPAPHSHLYFGSSFHGEKRLGEKFDLRTAETVTQVASVCNRSADTGLNSVCFCWNLHAASRALCLRSLFSELWLETAERPEAAPANGYRRGLAAAAGRRRQCGGAASTVRLQRRRYTSLLGVRPCS